MEQTTSERAGRAQAGGPPRFDSLDHVSLPCRDLDEGIRFYRDVLGGELVVSQPAFAMFQIADARIGIGSAGCTFMTESAEYPHLGFAVAAEALVRMKEWLGECGVPTSDFWTRQGVETLMFFRDPSGNVIELYCHGGYAGAADLPRGPARGHGTTIDVDALHYTEWRVPGGSS